MKRFFHIVFFLTVGFHSFSTIQAQKAVEVVNVGITVSDLDQAVTLFEEVLSFEKVGETQSHDADLKDLFGMRDAELIIEKAQMKLGAEYIELIDFLQPLDEQQIPVDARSNDLWFQHLAIVVNDMDEAYEMLKEANVQYVSTAPQTLPDYIPAAAGISAFYFRDHDGHNLEVIYFPKGKGDPKWQNVEEGPFIGVDHTAIGISDTDMSTKFYSDFLEFEIKGNSENYGPEQEHLNQVFGAHLLITGLGTKKGFGVEFLDYLAPPGGKLYPEDSEPNDLWHYHTTIRVDDIQAMYNKCIEADVEFISTKIVDLSETGFEGEQGFMIRDPDGHALLIIE